MSEQETQGPVNVWSVANDLTSYYTIAPEDRPHIKRIVAVYAYDANTATRLCELTPSYYLEYLYTYVETEGEVSEEIRNHLDETYAHVPTDDEYWHCHRVEALPPERRKHSGTFDSMPEAVEYLRGNCPF